MMRVLRSVIEKLPEFDVWCPLGMIRNQQVVEDGKGKFNIYTRGKCGELEEYRRLC